MSEAVILDAAGLDALIGALKGEGYRTIGPVRRDGAVVYEDVDGLEDLPRGWVDEQDGGHYRLKREGEAVFGYVVGPSSAKRFLHPPEQPLWRYDASQQGAEINAEPLAEDRYAFIGLRGCELAAIAVQDGVFLDGPFRDPHYAARRGNAFLVAVNCARAAATCFCPSMGTGPAAGPGYDIALTELDPGETFLAEPGSDKGKAVLDGLSSRPATEADEARATEIVRATEASITRSVDTDGLPDLLKASPEHPRWDDVASRCLNCANCTMVCPTCFCTEVEEVSDLENQTGARVQHWASCFTVDFSYVHGGATRTGSKARYRQWMTHKLATWHDQFDMSGCTGCGRCIAWCPVGIDITEEAAAIRGEG